MAMVIVFCEQERERKAPLIRLVYEEAEIIKFHQVLCLALLLGAPALTYPFLFFSFPLLTFS
jgi:hypothetical protein